MYATSSIMLIFTHKNYIYTLFSNTCLSNCLSIHLRYFASIVVVQHVKRYFQYNEGVCTIKVFYIRTYRHADGRCF